MTVTTDSERRVLIPTAEPGDQFKIETLPDGKVVLSRVQPEDEAPRKIEFIEENGYIVARTGHPITQEQVRKALDEFP